MKNAGSKKGYYTVHVLTGDRRVPYTVFAASDYHAARLIFCETGYLAGQIDVHGPHAYV